MAKTYSKKNKLRQMPPAIPAAQDPDPAKNAPKPDEPHPDTPFDPPPAAQTNKPGPKGPRSYGKGGRPLSPDVLPKTLTFFDRVAKIPAEDWGTRAKIRAYRLAPIIDRLRGSECKFICIYQEALTEERLKADHGSGRYRLYLAYKGAGEVGEKDLDRIELDILDPKYPPNIPMGDWVEDQRNKTWSWARPRGLPGPNYAIPGNAPAATEPAPNPAEVVLDGIRIANDMRKEIRAEMQPPAANGTSPAPAVDPWAAAERILNMRSDNPMVTILQTELTALREQMGKRDDRMDTMQKELFQAKIDALQAQLKHQTPNGESKTGLLESAKELATFLGVQPADMMKRFLGVGENPVKSKMSGWMELLTEVVPTIVNAPIMTTIAARLQPQPAAAPIVHTAATPINGQPANPQKELFDFVDIVVTPSLIEYLRTGNNGGDFAEWVYNGFPPRLKQLQNLTYPGIPGTGAPVIMELYKHVPAWSEIQPHEADFRIFVDEFCKWQPAQEAAAAAATASGDPDNAPKGDF